MAHQERHRKIREEHQQAITSHDKQIKGLEFVNEKHQQKILKFNKEIIANWYVARRGYFDNVLYFIKKNSREVHPYYVIPCQLEKHKQWLKLCYQTWRWLTNVMIQMSFTDGTGLSVK